MRNKLTILAAVVLISGCAASVSQRAQEQEPAPSEARDEKLREAKPEEVPFAYDPNDYGKVQLRENPKLVAEETEGFPIEAPAHRCFYLEDKRSLPAFEKGARYFYPAYSSVCIIPLTDGSVSDFAKAYPHLHEAAAKLRKLLKARPRKFKPSKDINDLPFNNASGAIQSKVQYLDFRTGTGVVFLTQYSQEMEPNPVNNEELTYNFQGLTTNGKYYVAARLALSHPSLPRGIDYTDHIKRDRDWRYLRKGEQTLERFTEDSFRPSLKTLKSLLSSISVE